jgi:UDP-N-acetylmuramoyl-tripeptide--D-alanyl-D-alanine ligase
MMLTLERAAAATSAQVRGGDRFPSSMHVITDTRKLQPGDTFLALRGENFDGHAFIRDAVQKGAAAVVVDDAAAIPDDVPALVVDDTKRAFMNLASAARSLFAGRVVAITGSAGKTTTKHLLAQLLAVHYGTDRVLASPANENNEIGVSKLLLSAAAQHAVLVVEMGARHEGEIAELVQIAHPHIGVLTNIGEAHLEIFGSRDALARTKWGLFSGGAQAVLNADDEESAKRAPSLDSPPLWFGVGKPRLPGVWITGERKLIVSNGAQTQELPVDIRLPGRHNRQNLAAALAAALLLGVAIEDLAAATADLALPAGRYQAIDVAGNVRVIYDAYNANLSGMIASLDAFACEQAVRRIAVLSSMAELGSDAVQMHERVGAHAAHCGIETLLVGGDYADAIARGALAAGLSRDRIVAFTDNAQAAAWLRAHAEPGDVVLLKGSRKYKMEEIVQELLA